MNWQPINTAPKPRHERQIVWLSDGYQIGQGYWMNSAGFQHGWCWVNSEYADYCTPTHWMPFKTPDPPTPDGEKGTPR